MDYHGLLLLLLLLHIKVAYIQYSYTLYTVCTQHVTSYKYSKSTEKSIFYYFLLLSLSISLTSRKTGQRKNTSLMEYEYLSITQGQASALDNNKKLGVKKIK